MYVYEVIVKPVKEDEIGAFAGLDLGSEGYFDLVRWNEDGTEVYEVGSEWEIDTRLDRIDGVISYRDWS